MATVCLRLPRYGRLILDLKEVNCWTCVSR